MSRDTPDEQVEANLLNDPDLEASFDELGRPSTSPVDAPVQNAPAKSSAVEERRVAQRKMYVTRVLVLQQNGRLFEGKSIDISESGLSLIAPFNLVANEYCRMRLELIGVKTREMLEVDAKIVYSVYQSTKGFKVGMQFNNLPDAQKNLIRQFINTLSK